MPGNKLLSERAFALEPSLTLEINARAKELAAQGRDICSLSAGEPDFNTPNFIIEAAVRALKDGITRYGPVAGDPELREAIAEKITTVNNVATDSSQVLVTNGGKQAIYNLFQVLLEQGDEVLIPSPYWLSYPAMAKLAGATIRYLPSSPLTGFTFDIEGFKNSITKKTKLLILNSPGNPTGRVMQKQEMEAIAEILRCHPNIFLMSDEIYEFLIDDDQQHTSFAEVAPDLSDRVFTVNGFAKGWAMTGWRVGYLSGNSKIVKAAIALQSQSTSNVCSFAQKGALAALRGSKRCLIEMARSYSDRRLLLSNGIKEISGFNLVKPKGAFYAFPELPQNCCGSVEFCKNALEKTGLAIVPGIAFGDDRCIRLSCAVSPEKIKDGLYRLKMSIDNILS